MPTRITSSMEHQNCVFSVRLIQAMPTDKAIMGICLSISSNREVSRRLLLKSVNYRGSILSYIHHIHIDHNVPKFSILLQSLTSYQSPFASSCIF